MVANRHVACRTNRALNAGGWVVGRCPNMGPLVRDRARRSQSARSYAIRVSRHSPASAAKPVTRAGLRERSPTRPFLANQRLHFLSVGRYAVKVRPLLVDNIRFRLVNKPGCQHEKIGACEIG